MIDGHNPTVVWNDDVLRQTGLTQSQLARAVKAELREIERRRGQYLGNRPRAALTGATVIVVDDGIATGATVKAALAACRREDPARLILAVPVAPDESIAELGGAVDAIICLERLRCGAGVGHHYLRFEQLDDAAVVAILDAAARRVGAGATSPAEH